MDDLIAFVTARLGEDEAAAKAAAQSGNQYAERGGHDPRWQRMAGNNGGEVRDMCSPRACVVVFDEGAPDSEQAAHIARHDPARALREAEAKRAIIALHKTDIDPADALYGSDACCGECGTYVVFQGPCKALRILAAIWDDHPRYRPEWSLTQPP